MNNRPPLPGRWLLRMICSSEHYDEIAGDLEEIYRDRLQARGRLVASIFYIRDVMLSARNLGFFRINRAMAANLVTISIRSLKKRWVYSLLNIGGLAASVAFSFLLWLYVQDQVSYDNAFPFSDRIYRVNLETDMGGKVDVYCNAPQPTLAALKATYPQIEAGARVALTNHIGTLEYKDKKSRSVNFVIADPPILELFDKEFIEGHKSNALIEPASVVISRSMAESIFGSIDAVGKVVYFIESEKELKVTGVMEDDLRQSHFPMDVIVSWDTFKEFNAEEWYGFHTYTYILLNEVNDIDALQKQMPSFFDRYFRKTFDEFNGKGKLFFQPITEIHLSDELVWEPNPHGSRANVLALSLVALLLIVFAVINYLNLSTAQAAERAGEVSIRKIMGSSRQLLWGQFLTESILLATSAGVLGLVLAWTMLPSFNELTGLNISTHQFFAATHIKSIFLLAIGIGLVSGIFPAFYLSSSPAVSSLKGKLTTSPTGEMLRRLLVGTQYFVAAFLISGIILVFNQVSFIKNKDIGFNRENLINIKIPSDSVVKDHIQVYMQAIKTSPKISAVSAAHVDLHRETNSFSPTLQNPDGTEFQMGADIIWIDADFINTIGAQIMAGRNFDKNIFTDHDNSVLINEAAMRKFGWEKDPLNAKFIGWTPNEKSKRDVIGVVKDFHLGVSYQFVHPTIIFDVASNGSESNLYVRINGEDLRETLAMIESTWNEQFPDHKIEYSFVDQDLRSLYNREDNFIKLLLHLCVVIVVIASLGIIGLISYTGFRRKEIAIRKVLGSSFRNIIAILAQKFVLLLIIANVLSIPATWYLVDLWLSNFAYRAELSPVAFVAPLIACVIFTGLSIGFHTTRAALANPVDSLRCE
jgi:putative ABC transport system permease protein